MPPNIYGQAHDDDIFHRDVCHPDRHGADLLTDEEAQLRALDWEDHAPSMHRLLRLHYGSVRLEPKGAASAARRAIEAYFEGELAAIDSLPVKTGGTAFQRAVWAALRTIPTGETTTYGRLAAGLEPAKGDARGWNGEWCEPDLHHRPLSSGDRRQMQPLTGYGGGLERKRWLLRHEGVDC